MSLMLYGSSVPEPAPEPPAPEGRRRYLIVFASVIALILGAGSAAFLLLNSSPNINSTAPNSYQPPAGATATDSLPDSPSASSSASPSASPSHSPSPSHSASVRPSTSAPTPVTYFVGNDGLCPATYFQPVIALNGGQPGGTPSDDHTDKSNYVDWSCHQQFGKISATVDAMIFTDAASAAQTYADLKSFSSPSSDKIPGIGHDAYGYVFQTTTYILFALDGNLVLKIQLGAAGGVPTPGRLRDDCAVKMAPQTMRNLAVKA